MKDKKAAKKIIKLAKKHPNWYTPEEVKYAKQVKWKIKQEEKEIEKMDKKEYTEKEYWDGEVPDELFEEYLKKYGYDYTP